MGQLKNRGRWEEVKADLAVLPPMGPSPRRANLPCRSAPTGRRQSVLCESRGRRRLRWLFRTAGALALVVFGMLLREAQVAWGTPRALRYVPPLESFLWWDSFSEVEQTRAVLRAHALRAIAESRTRYLQIRRRPGLGLFSEDSIAERALGGEIERLKRLMDEFSGTEQEPLVVGELLHVLQKAGRDHEWLDVYLDGAYRWPLNELFVWSTRHATELGQRLRRAEEVAAVIQFRGLIPSKYRPQATEASDAEPANQSGMTTKPEIPRPWAGESPSTSAAAGSP